MASTFSVITKRDTDSQILSPILDKLDEESLKKLEPFISEIEEHIQQTIESVPQNKLKQRKREAMISAAIYDTFLTFEKRTAVRVSVEFIADCNGILMTAINQNWRSLFDTRVKLDGSRIELISGKEQDLVRLISEVVKSLQDALEKKTPEIQQWFVNTEEEAIDLLTCLNRERLADYPAEVIAAAAVYGAVQCDGKPLVKLSQMDVSFTIPFSPQMISKTWKEIFQEGRISSPS
ncbi:MAG: hypothetical protein ACTSV2_11500 [Candidatus Thorarchaeota archaeon]